MKTGNVTLVFLLFATMAMAQKNTIANNIKPYTFETHYIDINDSTTIAYVDEGAGDKTLVFIHGLATYLPSWRKNIKVLKNKYRCIAIDLPGYGRSSKDRANGSMAVYADVVNQLIQALKLKNVVLVGHSMGAQITLVAALKQPNLLAIILAAPAGFETFNEDEAKWLKAVFNPNSIAAATPDQIAFNYGLNFFKISSDIQFMIDDRINMTKSDDFMEYCKVVSQGVSGMLDEPVFEKLKTIKLPVMAVYGKEDGLIPNKYLHKTSTTLEVAKKGLSQLKLGELKMISECGHFVPFEKPDIFNDIIVEFLSDK